MQRQMVDGTELRGRVEGLQKRLREEGIDGSLLLQRADLIYYTGAVFQGALLLPTSGEGRLFVWKAAGRIGEECPFPVITVKGFGRLPEALEGIAPDWRVVGIEEDTVPVGWWRHAALAVWPDAGWRDIGPAIRWQRSVKSPAEREHTRASGAALSAGFQALPGLIEEGIPEYEVQAQMDVVMRRAGDQAGGRVRGFNGEARGVVAWGPSASVDAPFDGPIGQPGRNPLAPMGAGGALLEPGLPIIVDHTAGVNGYMTDMTRTFSLGSLEARFTEAHAFCVQVLEEVVRRFVPGAIPAELYAWALAEAEQAGFAEHFMNRGPNKVRFLGHGIGLEMDEWPVLARPFTDPLIEGQVMAIEPKVIFEEGGVGVEDTVICRPGGGEVVTDMDRRLRDVS